MSSEFSLFEVGAVFKTGMSMTPEVIDIFQNLSGDTNPVHADAAYAQEHGFRAPIVYGNLFGALISRLVGMCLPTHKVIIMRESIDFRSPAYQGDFVELSATVASVHEAVQSVQLKLEFLSGETQLATGLCVVKCL